MYVVTLRRFEHLGNVFAAGRVWPREHVRELSDQSLESLAARGLIVVVDSRWQAQRLARAA